MAWEPIEGECVGAAGIHTVKWVSTGDEAIDYYVPTAHQIADVYVQIHQTSLLALAQDEWDQYEAHRVDLADPGPPPGAVHGAADATNVLATPRPTTVPEAIDALNDIRDCYEQNPTPHRTLVAGGVHNGADAINVLAAGAAADVATAVLLANDYATQHTGHLAAAPGVHAVPDTVNGITAAVAVENTATVDLRWFATLDALDMGSTEGMAQVDNASNGNEGCDTFTFENIRRIRFTVADNLDRVVIFVKSRQIA